MIDINSLLNQPGKAELYHPGTTSFTDDVVFAAMKIMCDVIQNGKAADRDVFEAAQTVLRIASNPIPLNSSQIKWKSPM